MRAFVFAAGLVASVAGVFTPATATAAEDRFIVTFVEVERPGLKGAVCDERGVPWRNLALTFRGAEGDQNIQAVTDPRGVFTVDLPNGPCTLRIDPDGAVKGQDIHLSRCDGLRLTARLDSLRPCLPTVLDPDGATRTEKIPVKKGDPFMLRWDSVNVNEVRIVDAQSRSEFVGRAAGSATYYPTRDTTYLLTFIGDPGTRPEPRKVMIDVVDARRRLCGGPCLGLLGVGAAALAWFLVEDGKADSAYERYRSADTVEEINHWREEVDAARRRRDLAGGVSLAGFGSGGVWIARNTFLSLRAGPGGMRAGLARRF